MVKSPTKEQSKAEKKYLCEYRYRGERWSIHLYASSFEEAEYRLQALSQGKVLGESKAIIPVKTKPLQKILLKLHSFLGHT